MKTNGYRIINNQWVQLTKEEIKKFSPILKENKSTYSHLKETGKIIF